MNASEKRKKRLAHSARMREHANRRARAHKRFSDLGIKTQSLSDLLPPGAVFEVDEDGTVKIDVKAKRGTEDEAAADIARRLNLDPSLLEVKAT